MQYQLLLIALMLATLYVSEAIAAPVLTRYDQVLGNMRDLQDRYPNIVTPFDIGRNDQGLLIHGVRIQHPDFARYDGKNHLIVAAHHGNELLSVDVAMRFANDVARMFAGAPSRYQENLRSDTFHVIPVLNISGYNANRRSETRSDGRRFDSNRDYPDPCGDEPVFKLASTMNLANYIDAVDAVSAVTIHGYIGTFTFPWGTYTNVSQTLDHDMFQTMAQNAVRANSYRAGTHGELIYPTVGAFEDWAYYAKGVWVALLELANRPDIGRDSQAMVAYFATVPEERSDQHDHLGECINGGDEVRSRP